MPDLHPPIACPVPCPGLFWVYILQSADGTYYVGQTRDLGERLRKHQLGLGSKHTHDHVAPRLVYVESLNNLTFAVQRERQIKGWSRAKKAALIRDDGVVLRRLSRSHEQTLKRDLCSIAHPNGKLYNSALPQPISHVHF